MKRKIALTIVVHSLVLGAGLEIQACVIPPDAVLNVDPTYAKPGDTITFDGRESYPGGAPITEYHFDFGDGSPGEHQYWNPADPPPGPDFGLTTHVYGPGLYTVALTVVNAGGGYDTDVHPRGMQVIKIIYVDENASGAKNGTSWTDAYRYLQDALVSGPGFYEPDVEVWVAAGIYRPDQADYNPDVTGDATDSFGLWDRVRVYGGFSGSGLETDRDQRSWISNKTYMSGDLGGDNSYHVVDGSGVGQSAVLDGFVITGGVADGGGTCDAGGGMYNDGGSPKVMNCSFEGNAAALGGGAMYNKTSSPTVTNCTFSGNSADYGGAVYNSTSSNPTFNDCVFIGNEALGPSYGDAGAMANQNSSPTLTDCVFSGNKAAGCFGGAVANQLANPQLDRCIFIANEACTHGGAIHNYQSSPSIAYCTFVSNVAHAGDGGAVNNYSSSDPSLANCLLADNSAGRYGGGMNSTDSYCDPTVTNCTFSGNSAGEEGGGVRNMDTGTTLTSCILWGNSDKGSMDQSAQLFGGTPTVNFCCIQGWGAGGTGNISQDPWFVQIDSWVPIPGVVSYWRFDEDTGSDVLDSSGNNDGTINGATRIPGKYYGGLSFDGSTQSVTVADDSSLDIIDEITISAWINTGTSGSQTVVAKADGTNKQYGIRIDSSNIYFYTWGSDASMSAPYILVAGQWYHIAATFDSSSETGQIYINGSPSAGDTTASAITSAASDVFIGAEGDGGGITNGFVGTIDEVAIFSKALSSEEIEDLSKNAWNGPGDYHLLVGSPCINKGEPSGDYSDQVDIDGESRRMVCRVDIGADEVAVPVLVDKDTPAAPIDQDGLDWTTAYGDLQDTLDRVSSGEEVWVKAASTEYIPTSGGRDGSFTLKPDVEVYGGFAGTEISRDERDWMANETTLSGDLDGDGPGVPDADNALHVVRGADGAILDGFRVVEGSADQSGMDSRGGGMLNDGVSPIVRNCKFAGNYAVEGGALYNSLSTARIVNCIFSGNTANSGAGIYNQNSNASIVDCVFSENDAAYNGDGVYNFNSHPGIVGCIVRAKTNESIFNLTVSTPYVSYSDVEGCGLSGEGPWDPAFGHDGGDNDEVDPQFNADLEPQATECLGTGVAGENMGANQPVDATVEPGVAPVTVADPIDLAISSAGNLYALRRTAADIKVYNDQLQLQNTITLSGATNPEGLALDGDDKIYLADTGNDCVRKYLSDGTVDSTFGTGGSVSGFSSPRGIAVSYDGYVYVTDSGSNKVQILKADDGSYVGEWGQYGIEPAQLDNPTGICLFGIGETFIVDTGNDRVQKLATSGYFINDVGYSGLGSGEFSSPRDASYNREFDQLFVADTGNNRIQIFQLNTFGEFSSHEIVYLDQVIEIAGLTSPANVFSSPRAVACESGAEEQVIYIADSTDGGRVVKIAIAKDAPGGSPLHTWESFKTALRNGDVEDALSHFTDLSAERYAPLMEQLQPKFQDMLNDMDQMILISREDNAAVYHLLRDEGGTLYGYPVFFGRDGQGNWKISRF